MRQYRHHPQDSCEANDLLPLVARGRRQWHTLLSSIFREHFLHMYYAAIDVTTERVFEPDLPEGLQGLQTDIQERLLKTVYQ